MIKLLEEAMSNIGFVISGRKKIAGVREIAVIMVKSPADN